MKIFFASDHAGFEMKKSLFEYAKELGFQATDLGPEKFDPNDDYPLEIEKVAIEVFKDPNQARGVVLGGSGQGEAIVANRFPNVRAIVYYGGNEQILKLGREHNDANILSLGARFISIDEARTALKIWLETKFSGDERHVRRLKEIDKMEESLYINP
jgi:ribose 5-phosphate isomerase B